MSRSANAANNACDAGGDGRGAGQKYLPLALRGVEQELGAGVDLRPLHHDPGGPPNGQPGLATQIEAREAVVARLERSGLAVGEPEVAAPGEGRDLHGGRRVRNGLPDLAGDPGVRVERARATGAYGHVAEEPAAGVEPDVAGARHPGGLAFAATRT